MSVINISNTKKYILGMVDKADRKRFTRISKQFLDAIEADIKSRIERAVRNHPSVGKTLDEFRP